jgi:hypothetical protein
MTQGGTPFSVFTPYKNAWLQAPRRSDLQPFPVEEYSARLAPPPAIVLPGAGRPRLRADRPRRAAPARRHERRAGCSATSPSASTTMPQARLPRRRAVPTCRPTCASAPFRSASSPPTPMRSQSRRRDLALGTDLARLLPRHPLAPPARRHAVLQARFRRPVLGRPRPACSPPGAPAAPATRWSTRRCASSTIAAGCTTACAWSPPPS